MTWAALQGMGPIQHAKDEPVFHAAWEGRIFAINSSLLAARKWNLHAWRHKIELLPAVDYLQITDFERGLRINEQLLVKHGLITPAKLVSGTPDPGSAKARPALAAAAAVNRFGRGIPPSHD